MACLHWLEGPALAVLASAADGPALLLLRDPGAPAWQVCNQCLQAHRLQQERILAGTWFLTVAGPSPGHPSLVQGAPAQPWEAQPQTSRAELLPGSTPEQGVPGSALLPGCGAAR